MNADGWHEYNFDGLIGPTHNYTGMSFGNIASATNAGQVSAPRTAALQGLEKMRLMGSLGLGQGFFLPHVRPDSAWLAGFGFSGTAAEICAAAAASEPDLLLAAISASSMWAANAATVSPACDTADGRTHFTPANLATMAHRSHEWPETRQQLEEIFPDRRYFAIHDPVPAPFGDEGAANFMRIAPNADRSGTEIMVYGRQRDGSFPARQSAEACRAIFRRHGVSETLTVQQSDRAIAAGAFHNDVVAVSNGGLLFAHEYAFEDRDGLIATLAHRQPDFRFIEVTNSEVPLKDAITSYLFNSQLVTLPDGNAVLIAPVECRETPSVKRWLDHNTGRNFPIDHVRFVDVRESMRNGGGPACLRLRVLLSSEAAQAVNPMFLLNDRSADAMAEVIAHRWPERIAPADLVIPQLWSDAWEAIRVLRQTLHALRD